MYQRLLWVNTSHFMFSLIEIDYCNSKTLNGIVLLISTKSHSLVAQRWIPLTIKHVMKCYFTQNMHEYELLM